MRRLLAFLFLTLAFACDKDDDPEKFTSISGYWVVRTPDDATEVTFRIGQDADAQYAVENVFVRHNATDYNSKPIDAGISVLSDSQIESITLLNTVVEPPFFVIRFLDISANADFTEMTISNSTFNVDGAFREFPMIKATRP